MYKFRMLLIFCAICLPPTAGLPLAAQEEEKGWSGSADLGFTLTQGNSETATVALGFGTLHQAEHTRLTLDATYLWARVSGETSANRLTSSAQLDWFLSERFFLFGRLGVGFNKPAAIDLRLAPGAGLGYDLISTDKVVLAAEAAGNIISESFASDSTSTDFFVSAGLRFVLRITDATSLKQSLNWAPKASDFDNYRLHFDVTFITMFVERLGLRVSFVDDYNSRPFVDADGVAREKNDITLITGITLEF